LMIGRGAQGRPWLPGQIARYLGCGRREATPSLSVQFDIVAQLYDEILAHHGRAIGVPYARKHLGWALDAAADAAGAPDWLRRRARHNVLTLDDPRAVVRSLAAAFASFTAPARQAA
jgi:tRNA-dihydrouridine synthase B